jgi:hypothetical protein
MKKSELQRLRERALKLLAEEGDWVAQSDLLPRLGIEKSRRAKLTKVLWGAGEDPGLTRLIEKKEYVPLKDYIPEFGDKEYKGHVIRLKRELDVLKEIWDTYPSLQEDVFLSPYYRSLLPKLLVCTSSQVSSVSILENGPVLAAFSFQFYKVAPTALTRSFTFADYALTGKIKKIVESHQKSGFVEGYRPDAAPVALFKPRSAVILERIIKACATLDGVHDLISYLDGLEKNWHRIQGYEICVGHLHDPDISSPLDFLKLLFERMWNNIENGRKLGDFDLFEEAEEMFKEKKSLKGSLN